MSRIFQLGDLQYAIMRVLWMSHEASAAEVHEALYPERGLAPTTIATMLSKMEKKGVVAHRAEGRQYIYRAAVAEQDVRNSMVGELLDRVFQGDAKALVNHLLNERDIEAGELEELKTLIEERAREEGGHDDE
ncbi:MAG: BlaI/MecI/CopY family transcriptional regulator [Planctomycetota bacterium]